jgi:hypothetical protein
MQQTQVTAAIALLRKVMPDLSSTTVTGDASNPIVHKVIVTGVRRAGDLPRQGIPLPAPRVIEHDLLQDHGNGITSKDH